MKPFSVASPRGARAPWGRRSILLPRDTRAQPRTLTSPDGKLTVMTADDRMSALKQDDFGSWRFVSRSRIQDMVELVVRDGNSPKTATVAQRVTLK